MGAVRADRRDAIGSLPRTLVDSVPDSEKMGVGRYRGSTGPQFRVQEGHRVVRDVLDGTGKGWE